MAKRKSRKSSRKRRGGFRRLKAKRGIYVGTRKRKRRVRVRRGQRFYRRNPGGIMGTLVEGGKSAVAILVGQAATRAIRRLIPLEGGMAMNAGLGVGSALAAGMIARKVPMLSKYAPIILAAGLADVIRPLAAQVPVVGGYLGDDGDPLGIGGDFLGAFPLAGDNFLGAYPALGASEYAADNEGM